MQLEILQENLVKAISTCLRFVSPKPQVPILSHLLLSATSTKFTLTASNLETTLVFPVGAKIIKEGDFTVPARTLAEIVSSLSADKISLSASASQLEIKTGGFNAKINGTPATEYPPLTDFTVADNSSWQFSRQDFVSSVAKTTYCCALDEGRPILTGVLFRSSPEGLELAATDGFRLSRVTLPPSPNTNTGLSQAVLPAHTLTEVSKILSEGKSDSLKVDFFSENQVLFDMDDIKIYSRLISGNFPDFEKIIPPEGSLKIRLSSSDLAKAVRLASVFAKESANIVRLKLEAGKLVVSANAAQVGENESQIEVEIIKGEDSKNFQIAFNYRYLLDYLTSLDKVGDITIDFSTPLAPGVFHIAGDSRYLHLIMPVRVQS